MFRRQSDLVAAGFLAAGLEPGDRLGIWGPNSYEWYLTQFAAAKAGLILVRKRKGGRKRKGKERREEEMKGKRRGKARERREGRIKGRGKEGKATCRDLMVMLLLYISQLFDQLNSEPFYFESVEIKFHLISKSRIVSSCFINPSLKGKYKNAILEIYVFYIIFYG